MGNTRFNPWERWLSSSSYRGKGLKRADLSKIVGPESYFRVVVLKAWEDGRAIRTGDCDRHRDGTMGQCDGHMQSLRDSGTSESDG